MTEEQKFEEEIKVEDQAETSEENSEEAAGGAENETENAAPCEEKTEEATEPEESEESKYMRLLAEFQNFKKRTSKEKDDIRSYANEKLVGDILPVLDNFERALATSAADDPEAYAKGMNMIFDQLVDALTKVGLKEIESLGTDFDPNKHNAVMHADSEEYDEGKVCTVLQKGYDLNGRVVRPAMVAVAK